MINPIAAGNRAQLPMNMKWSLIIMGCLAGAKVHGQAISDSVNYYYELFSAPNDGTGTEIIFGDFYKNVPVADQAEVLANILERALTAKPPAEQVSLNVMSFLIDTGRDLPWNDRLEKLIYAQTKSSNKVQRFLAINLISQDEPVKGRDLILSLQNDPDEEVRYAVIHSIVRWLDAESIYKKFIQDHQSDPTYAKSVQAARNHIDIVHELQKASHQ